MADCGTVTIVPSDANEPDPSVLSVVDCSIPSDVDAGETVYVELSVQNDAEDYEALVQFIFDFEGDYEYVTEGIYGHLPGKTRTWDGDDVELVVPNVDQEQTYSVSVDANIYDWEVVR